MKKFLSLYLAAPTVVWCLAVSAQSAVAALAVSTSVEGAALSTQGEQKPPRVAAPDDGARGDKGQKKDLIRGREHGKAAAAAFELGVKYGHGGRYKEAVEAFSEAVLYDPGHADAHFSLGHALYDMGRWAEAAEAFKRALALNPKDAEAFNYLGAAYFRQGLYDKAIEAYKGAILLKPQLADVRYNIANAFYKLGRYEAAVIYYKEASYVGAKSAELFNDLGVAYAEWGRYGEASEAFERATGHNSDDAYAYNNLALASYLRGQHREAFKAFERATRLAPRDETIRRNAALASSSSDRSGLAVGDRVSLSGNTGAGGDRRVGRWLGRSEVIHGLGETGTPAPEKARTETASRSTTPVNGDTAPPPAQTPLKAASTSPPSTTLPTAAAAVTPGSETSGPSTPAEETGAAAGKSEPPSVAAPAPPAPTNVYRVGVGDVLDIRLLDDRSKNSTLYTVLAGGDVEYPPLGDPFAVAGKTTDEIAAHIKSELQRRAIHNDPRVVVSVRDYASHTVIISGLVAEPGAKLLRREAVPLYVLVADAQPLPAAGRALIISDAGLRRTEVALDDQSAMSTLVHPGDVINVLEKQAQFYYIGGKVDAPGQKDFHAGITLTQAILAAGGSLRASKNALVTRQSADGLLSTSSYSLKDIIAGSAPDLPVRPGDRIEVIR